MTENMNSSQINDYLRTLRMQALAAVIKAMPALGDSSDAAIERAAKDELKSLLDKP